MLKVIREENKIEFSAVCVVDDDIQSVFIGDFIEGFLGIQVTRKFNGVIIFFPIRLLKSYH